MSEPSASSLRWICRRVFQQDDPDSVIAGELDGGSFGELVSSVVKAYQRDLEDQAEIAITERMYRKTKDEH